MKFLVLPRVRRLGVTLTTLSLVLTLGIGLRSDACISSPVVPFCAKTLVLAKAGPPAVLVPAGVAPTFDVPYTVYWNMINVGGNNLCPPPTGPGGTFPATVTLDVDCVGGPGLAVPVVAPISLLPGYNDGVVSIVLPAGPPRVCNIIGDVDIGLADGMLLQSHGDSVVCIVDPAPGDPSLPRLDLQTLTPEIQNKHPGDQGRFDYRLVNNDPTESVTVDIVAEMENVSRLPDMLSPPGAPGTGVYSASDPLVGDNFPIGFDDDLAPAGCMFLPGDPSNPALKTASQVVTLAPGEVHDFSLHTRAWGLCADGSCGEGRLVIDGEFANGDPAKSCTGMVHAVDTSAPPEYQWPGSGQVVRFDPLDQFAVAMFSEPLPRLPQQMDNVVFPAAAAIADLSPQIIPQLDLFQNTQGERARYTYQMQLPGQPILPGQQGFFAWNMQYFSPSPVDQLQVTGVHMLAPNGFENLGPGAVVNVKRDGFGPPVESFFDIMYQVSGEAVDLDTGERVPIEIVALNLQSVSPIQVDGFAQFEIPQQLGVDYEAVELSIDLRGFGHGVADSDADGIPDHLDNCQVAQNGPAVPDAGGNVQRDTDGDGFGNLCDPDLDNNGVVNFLDVNLWVPSFNTATTGDADFNGDGFANFGDYGLFPDFFLQPPGPSALAP